MAHFIDLKFFKGSPHYPTAWHISKAIEVVGGVFNGSTDKELTMYTARVPGEQLPIVMEVLADMVRRPILDPQELEKERAVIIEELSSTRDDPQEWVSLLIDETMWPGLPLGRDDAGFIETVARLQQQDLLQYLNEYYRPNSLIISVAGNINLCPVGALTERPFMGWVAVPPRRWEARVLPLAAAHVYD